MAARGICLLITETFEPTADFLLAEMRARQLPCVRWNLDHFPARSELTYRAGDAGVSGEIVTDGRRVPLDQIGSIWCRGFRPLDLPQGLSDDEHEFLRIESQRALDALLTINDVLWINHPLNHTRANSKPAQLFLAQSIGLAIPDSLMTNDAAAVVEFIAASEQSVIYKPHSQTVNLVREQAIYTGVISERELANIDLIQSSPGIFQKLVPKAFEVRATVVGRKIFAGRIDSQAHEESRIDWRRRPFDINEEPISLPDDVCEKIFTMMNRFQITYGAFDFIVTPDGQYVFLEVNPAGQYLWIEAATKMPITAAIADLLAGPLA